MARSRHFPAAHSDDYKNNPIHIPDALLLASPPPTPALTRSSTPTDSPRVSPLLAPPPHQPRPRLSMRQDVAAAYDRRRDDDRDRSANDAQHPARRNMTAATLPRLTFDAMRNHPTPPTASELFNMFPVRDAPSGPSSNIPFGAQQRQFLASPPPSDTGSSPGRDSSPRSSGSQARKY
ncbi:hypothetical protein BOTBODRAFT_179410 [Botryobasidium botryosum FD-172 SS1]|uniref:Uncharacterized protein n=1 Tax=Botryobasidium botryosum (strain FD-172 SS1) TaxID=930990 RepID=A0A067MAP8_BOTB1|nr:hypothetical protein BOTBODRAFT_179410 [Botryobasidium botryosum FD-172 SS1]